MRHNCTKQVVLVLYTRIPHYPWVLYGRITASLLIITKFSIVVKPFQNATSIRTRNDDYLLLVVISPPHEEVIILCCRALGKAYSR